MRKALYALVFLAFVFSGCADKASNDIVFKNAASQERNDKIIFEADISDWFIVENAAYLERDDGLMELEVIGKNRSSSTEVLTYRIDWFDKNGFVIDTIMSKWKIASVEAGRNIVIHAVSPSTNARTYKARIGEPTEEDELRDKNVNIREYRGE